MVEYGNRKFELGCQLQVASAKRLEILADRQPHPNKGIEVNCFVAVDVNLMVVRLSCSLPQSHSQIDQP